VKCRANAQAFARDRRVVAEIGPYRSSCAREQIPIAAAAPDGPLAIISPTNTDPLLTRDTAARDRGAYARLPARDDRVVAVAARHLRRLGHERVAILTDSDRGYGAGLAAYFSPAAKAAGLEVAGLVTWAGNPRAVDEVARLGPDAVWVSATLDNGAGRMIARLRRRLGPQVTLAGADSLLPVATLFRRAGEAARGVLIATAFPPDAPVERFATRATEMVLEAIAGSDGSRRSVADAVRKRFDATGDTPHAPVAIMDARRATANPLNLSTRGARLVERTTAAG
jgi:ABC-type branched-subunit amino acid transport system substrate-binding protein